MKTGDPEVVVVLNRLAITVACLVAVIRWDCTPSKILLYICIPEARFVGVIVTW